MGIYTAEWLNNKYSKEVNKPKGAEMRLRLFNVRVLLHPREYPQGTIVQPENEEDTKLVLSLDNILAQTEQQAQSIAATQIPKEYLDRMPRVEVVVRPF